MDATTAPAPALGRYRLGRRLGAGGFGTVYRAVDERLGREVAVKVIPSDDGARASERSKREALTAARLDHPAIVAVLDAGEEDGVRYLVSELVEGGSLAELLAGEDGVSDRDALRVGLALCDALAHAHEHGVVHRDVKPANILVPDRGRMPAKLCDFGVAHLTDDPLTRTGDVVGTLAYMAPEQAEGKRVDWRCDLYSAALVIYEAFTGRNPVRAASPAATARKVGQPVPSLAKARPDLPVAVCAAIDRALKPQPGQRGSVDELAQALQDALPAVSDEGRTLARLPAEGGPIQLTLRAWHRRVLGGAGAAALSAYGAGLAAASEVDVLPQAALCGVLVALVPRLGWVLASTAVLVQLALDRPGLAVAGAAALLLVPVLLEVVPALARKASPLRRTTTDTSADGEPEVPRECARGTAWSVPGAAPALALIALGPVHATLAGQARRLYDRAALGAIGGAWILVASIPAGPWRREPAEVPDALLAVASTDWPVVPALAVGAAVLPYVVRGRHMPTDVVGAAVWSGALGAATQLPGPALLAGALAVAVRALAGPVRRTPPAILEGPHPG